MGPIELLDSAAKLFAVRAERDGIDPKTIIALLTFYVMERRRVAGVNDEKFYESLLEDFGADVVGLVETYIRVSREILDHELNRVSDA